MSGRLRGELQNYLTTLEQTQTELVELYQQKRTAMRHRQAEVLASIAEPEQKLTQQLQQHLTRREEILRHARLQGHSAGTLSELADILDGMEVTDPPLPAQVARVRQHADRIRRECWMQWIIAHRTLNQFGDLLDLIAHCGKTNPTYNQRPSEETGGGAILDTSV